MDLQNVSSLVIPEGNVRTIHDKNSRLLWGRLNYNTRYMGNAIQDGTPTPDNPVSVDVVTGEQIINVTGKNLFNKNGPIENGYLTNVGNITNTLSNWRVTDYIAISPNTAYTTSGMVTGSGNNPSRCYYDKNKTFISGMKHWSYEPFTHTSPANAYYLRDSFQLGDINKIQIENGSSATNYESYQAHSYTVNLGSVELCKIGDYQDYIYKSGDDWYVHKVIGHDIADGNTVWTKSSSGTNNYYFSPTQTVLYSSAIANTVIIMSSCFTGVSYSDRTSAASNITYENQTGTISVRNNTFNTKEELTTFCANNPIDFYYVLATPTESQIVDSTLIDQLNAVHQFLTRYGYNATVSGNLPMIIDKTNL